MSWFRRLNERITAFTCGISGEGHSAEYQRHFWDKARYLWLAYFLLHAGIPLFFMVTDDANEYARKMTAGGAK